LVLLLVMDRFLLVTLTLTPFLLLVQWTQWFRRIK